MHSFFLLFILFIIHFLNLWLSLKICFPSSKIFEYDAHVISYKKLIEILPTFKYFCFVWEVKKLQFTRHFPSPLNQNLSKKCNFNRCFILLIKGKATWPNSTGRDFARISKLPVFSNSSARPKLSKMAKIA